NSADSGALCATMGRGMAPPRRLTEDDERQVVALVAAGVRQDRIGAAFAVSRRTVCRVIARRRGGRREPTIEELLEPFGDPDSDARAVTATPRRQTPRRKARGRAGWEDAATVVVANRATARELGLDDGA